MKRLLLILPLLIGLVSCSSCSKKETSPAPCDAGTCSTTTVTIPAPPPPSEQVLHEEDWSLSLPQGWEKLNPPTAAPEIKVFYGNESQKTLVIFMKEPFAGSNNEYVLSALRGLKDNKGVLNTLRQVDLNGNKFVLLDSTYNSVRMWIWIVVRNGFGYSLSCGGPADMSNQEEICTNIANTLKVK